MAVINMKKKEVQVKIVYYGPGRGGKTTNLEYIRKNNKKHSRAELVKIETRGERTLLFDFLPFEVGKVNGFDVKVHLYTAPGQEKYESCRRLVLNGVDGVVFVADSMAVCKKRNLVSFENLKEDLAHNKKKIDETPMVIQCNKADLAKEGVSVLPLKNIVRDLGVKQKTSAVEASALFGKNVISTLKKIIVLTLESIEGEIKKHVISGAAVSPPASKYTSLPVYTHPEPEYSPPPNPLAYAGV